MCVLLTFREAVADIIFCLTAFRCAIRSRIMVTPPDSTSLTPARRRNGRRLRYCCQSACDIRIRHPSCDGRRRDRPQAVVEQVMLIFKLLLSLRLFSVLSIFITQSADITDSLFAMLIAVVWRVNRGGQQQLAVPTAARRSLSVLEQFPCLQNLCARLPTIRV
jgi:hypothetical protein